MRQMLNGSNFDDREWLPRLRGIVSEASMGSLGQAPPPDMVTAQHLGSRLGLGQDVIM